MLIKKSLKIYYFKRWCKWCASGDIEQVSVKFLFKNDMIKLY